MASKHVEKIKALYKENKKSSLIWYLVLRTFVIITMVLSFFRGDYSSVFLCILTLILFLIPFWINNKLNIDIPNVLEIIIFLFIFSAEILGEINNFYAHIPNWDTILHTLNGFLCAAIGLSLIDLLNKNSKSIHLSPLYVAIASFCFSMTIGVCWEFFEYGADKILNTDMQKDELITSISSVEFDPFQENKAKMIKGISKTILYDENNEELITIEDGYLDIGLNDTMEDLWVNFIGASIYSILGYFYIKNRDKYSLASKFIITKQK